MILMMTENGSFILADGTSVIFEEDLEAFYDGSLEAAFEERLDYYKESTKCKE